MNATLLEVPLASIESCFEGTIPAAICTLSAEGTPNVTYLSVVQMVDANHVALSRQFFNKTDQYTTQDPRAQVIVVEPATGRQFRLDLIFDHIVTSGPLFERMKANLDAVATQEGMTDIFVLKGIDICRVTACTMVPCDFPEPPSERRDPGLELLHSFANRISSPTCLDDLLDCALRACSDLYSYDHGMVMLVDSGETRLYTVASLGFEESGAGSEVPMGEGLAGVAAARKRIIRVANLAQDRGYTRAARKSMERASGVKSIERDIPLPGLPTVMSEMAVPLIAFGKLVGVLMFQSPVPGRFRASDEHLAGIVASHLGVAVALMQMRDQEEESGLVEEDSRGPCVQVKHYCEDDSVFVANEYLIKGVAGRILWRLLQVHVTEDRTEFSNRELRLDPGLDLPDIKDNLEARLILLTKRLEEKCEYIRLDRTARGRFTLLVNRPLQLVEVEYNSG